ncbi:MAG: class I SAM-dependent methyltransferase [Oscillospiraceae bacterium]|nr:class I SAM-dependent methyltransferase [Oscillospiraceae bacterium]
MITLDARLTMVAELIVPGRKIVDVGTDHGFLPAFMLLSGRSPVAVASDIGEKPLQNAQKTVRKYHLENRLRLVHSDGLAAIAPADAEEIVIAGIGGTLIARVLAATPWLREPGRHLVLQPMSRAEEVRRFLCENGFYIDREAAAADGGRLYGAVSAYWDGRENEHSLGYYHFGELPKNGSHEARRLIEKHAQSLRACRKAILNVERRRRELAGLDEILTYYQSIERTS